jgi:LysR family transcriptional regulator, low CO2-responsive transcriptional regulator
MRPTLHQLRLFEAVARRLSFTRAAEELYLTQPTVSMQIKQLADDIGLPLFEQIGKKISLTDAGRELYDTTREMFDAWSRFEMRVADLRGMKQGQLKVAVATTAKYFIPDLLGKFLQHYPDVDVRLEIANREKLLERMESNQDDLYILVLPPEDAAIERVPFLPNPLVPIAPADHRLAGERAIPLERLAAERFISREPGSGTRIQVARYFGEQGVQLNVRMELGSNEAIKHAVAAGLGISIVSQHTIDVDAMSHRLAVLDVVGFPLVSEWYVVYPHGKRLSVVAKTFLAYMQSETPVLRAELDLRPAANSGAPATQESANRSRANGDSRASVSRAA